MGSRPPWQTRAWTRFDETGESVLPPEPPRRAFTAWARAGNGGATWWNCRALGRVVVILWAASARHDLAGRPRRIRRDGVARG